MAAPKTEMAKEGFAIHDVVNSGEALLDRQDQCVTGLRFLPIRKDLRCAADDDYFAICFPSFRPKSCSRCTRSR